MVDRIFASPEHRRRFFFHLLVVFAVVVLLAVVLAPYLDAVYDVRDVRRFVRGFGSLVPLAFIALHALQVIFVPIPGQVVGIAGGYLFGPFWGIVYTMCGVTIGSFVAFFLARRFGRPYITTIFATDVVERYDATISKLGVGGLTLIVMVPGLPDDLICFVCGTSELTSKEFLVLVILGRTPAFALAVLSGAEFGNEQVYRGLALALLLAVLSILGYIERERIRQTVLDWFGE